MSLISEVSSDGGETSSSAAEESVDEASSSQKLTSTPNPPLNHIPASDPLTNLSGRIFHDALSAFLKEKFKKSDLL